MFGDELFAQRDAQARSVGHRDPTVLGLNLLVRKLMAHGRIIDAIFEQKRIPASGEPVQAGSYSHRAGVAMIAQPRADFLNSRTQIRAIGETAS